MNYTYEKKFVFGKECVTEIETGYFVILKDFNSQVLAFNFKEKDKKNSTREALNKIKNSRESLARIKKWVQENYPEYFM
jgi:hypothetical protein